MTNNPDPSIHQQRERQAIEHIERILSGDPRLRLDTRSGSRMARGLLREITRSDGAVELKRLMSQMGLPDRELESRMPIGMEIEATFYQRRMLVLKTPVARVKAIAVSPTRQLLKGETPEPMTTSQLQKLINAVPPPLAGVPVTLIVISTSGFTLESHELIDRRADRTLILMEPNAGGGWSIHGRSEVHSLIELLDPEDADAKQQRIRDAIAEAEVDLLTSGITGDRIAGKTQLPIQMVEQELKSYASKTPGLIARRIDGRMVVFREGTLPEPVAAAENAKMPLIDRIKALFSRKGETQKKIEFLSERRAALSLKRDKMYEDLAQFEKQEAMLRRQFREATGAITKKRVTQQLLQLRKDADRRQQMIDVLNRQINVVGTHLHSLELVQQGQSADLPDSDELAADAVAAEEMLAQLEADSELAESLSTSGGIGRMTPEEQALYDELEREASAAASPASQPSAAASKPATSAPAPSSTSSQHQPPTPAPAQPQPPQRSEPEAG